MRDSLKYTITYTEKAIPEGWIGSGGRLDCNSKRKDDDPEEHFWKTLRPGSRVVMYEDCSRTGVNLEIAIGVSEKN